ncbi:MAG TPA: TM0106 family RecB-like putative nuclease, partial [Bryobacteraceae bacterium]|nr:TM0106 family RecB-like putative nuclease [Bryobacteraceae bacterium]
MKAITGTLRLSASDLSNHLSCTHVTSLDLGAATGARPAPDWRSPDLWILQERGRMHEAAYLQFLAEQGLEIVDLSEIGSEQDARSQTLRAMERGAEVITQATLADGRWFGRADVLRRVPLSGGFGDWSYEVYDCKLSSETKAGTILQLSLYSEILAVAQGVWPEHMYVVPPGEGFRAEAHRVTEYSAYYRHVKKRLEAAVVPDGAEITTYPEPVEHCGSCRWFGTCDAQRRQDDHLSLVAGISKLHRKQLAGWDVGTMEMLARMPLPLQARPDYGSKQAYVRLREQARMQVAGRQQQVPLHELLDVTDEHGFRLLPEPCEGDIFFDLESDPFVGTRGREYLFGFTMSGPDGSRVYECRLGLTADDERVAFEWFVDAVMAQWAKYPAMHVYHFTPYEPGALKRLMGRYATREDEIDRLLRGQRLVDVHTVVKRSVRASVEEYSLKALEAFHPFTRKVPLDLARQAMRNLQHRLELGELIEPNEAVLGTVAGYNADDCLSTESLRDWMERERSALLERGVEMPRPAATEDAPSEALSERRQFTEELTSKLRAGVPAEVGSRTAEEAARWLLADLLDWHRREGKVETWEFFRFAEMTDEDLLYERSAVSGLQYVKRTGVKNKIPTDRYRFDRQETNVEVGARVLHKTERIGEVAWVDAAAGVIDIKKTKKTAEVHPVSVFADPRGPKTDALADSLFRLGAWVAENGMDSPGSRRAARDLLLRKSPRLSGGAELLLEKESPGEAAVRIVGLLDQSVLAIQGPPGAGKTFTGARMILEAVKLGKRVGVTATSHKVIRKLLDEVVLAGPGVTCVQKVRDLPEEMPAGITLTTDNDEALSGGAQVVGGTAWLWAPEKAFEAVDVLFVDEAGQMALANVLAVANAAKTVVLLGDPQQLEQPLRGSHPEGAEASALQHILNGSKTIPPEQGLFLEQTWRLHPTICSFTSEAFYESRLVSRDGLENQGIGGHVWLGTAGLWFVPIRHTGNQTSSPEEVERIAGIVEGLLSEGTEWTDHEKRRRPLRLDDVLIVAPYNAQVAELTARL